ncbi:MAG: ATP-binding protein [Bacteroidales bacterium]|nr:ATP-binding protein [Bacteroidales bacterium]MBO7134929.1 ATP-binding protein [Bacteroidales bacterium]MBQ6277822.1 ATP-binding protein [Bacteroidales bacterium]
MAFKRKLYNEMLRWKESRKGTSALLIKGARRVGKSTLAENFARKEYKSYILIDFSKTSKQVDALFEDMMNLDMFFFQLQNIFGVKLHERKSVIIFDEVQMQPLARQAIKHLVKDGRYDYIETGSLLSIKKNVENIVIPSEETRLTLYPMDYDEFCWATGDTVSSEFLRQAFEMKHEAGNAVHRKWMRDLRLYMLIGGMPQAVDAYNKTNNLQEVDNIKREILQLYDDDLYKIDSTGRASQLFAAIPGQLSNNAGRYQVSSVLENQNAERVSSVVADMVDSMVINLSFHANDPNVGLGMSKDLYRYKMFVGDTGLFVTLAFKDKSYTENLVYQKLLSDKLNANLGYVYENLVAQMLKANGNELFYYTFPTENGKHNYEIDFLLSRGNKICPIEVKSSGYRSHKSLDVFCDKYSSRISDRILLYTKDYQQDGETTCMPVYFTQFL